MYTTAVLCTLLVVFSLGQSASVLERVKRTTHDPEEKMTPVSEDKVEIFRGFLFTTFFCPRVS